MLDRDACCAQWMIKKLELSKALVISSSIRHDYVAMPQFVDFPQWALSWPLLSLIHTFTNADEPDR
jgi:hypothetical protein